MNSFIEECKPHICNLIDIVNSVGVPMEGSLFYDDRVTNIHIDQIRDSAYEKAMTLRDFAIDKNEILEIGFNSGFSALIFLLANRQVKVTSVDLCGYQYTNPCFDYLKSQFNDRIELVPGESTIVLPELFKSRTNFDAYFIDGGHSDEVTTLDFHNILENCNSGVEVCADDYNFPLIHRIVQQHVDAGKLKILRENEFNVFLKVMK